MVRRKHDSGREGLEAPGPAQIISRRRAFRLIRALLVASAVGAGAYFVANASRVTIFVLAGGIVLLTIGLIRVAAWGLDNTPPFDS